MSVTFWQSRAYDGVRLRHPTSIQIIPLCDCLDCNFLAVLSCGFYLCSNKRGMLLGCQNHGIFGAKLLQALRGRKHVIQ